MTQLQSRAPQCEPSNNVGLQLATFFILSIFCHAATLHPAPGLRRRLILARAIAMIFSPVTAGLYSLMTLGRMWVAWISILSRTLELVARILAPETSTASDSPAPIPELPEQEITDRTSPIAGPSRAPSSPSVGSPGDPGSPVEKFQKSPIQSTWSIATQVAMNPKKLRQSSAATFIDITQELPHRMHTRALIAGAVAIHVPKRFTRLLRLRNWDRLSEDVRETTTEHSRLPSSDPIFEELSQFILPPTTLLLDKTLRLYPESMFREALAGLLQLGFGLYQLISSDARYSVARDGLASPFLIVLPYLGMAALNTVINVLDPPYSAVTVLDISWAARCKVLSSSSRSQSLVASPKSEINGFLSRASSFAEAFPLKLPSRKRKDSKDKEPNLKLKTKSTISEKSPSTGVTEVLSQGVVDGAERATWPEFVEWIQFAYERRIDVNPVDRLYRTPWLSHSIIIGECIYSAINGLLIPLVTLAVVGGWTRFNTSNYGLSLTFNLLAIFGLPFLQFVLFSHYLFVRVKREIRGRREHGADYWEPEALGEDEDGKRRRKGKERDLWWGTIAQSIGIYFPINRWVTLVYVTFIIGVAVCEFVFVGFNLTRTYGCRGVI